MLGSIYAMVGVALTLSIGVLKFLNFSIPGLFMIGGMATWALVRVGTAFASGFIQVRMKLWDPGNHSSGSRNRRLRTGCWKSVVDNLGMPNRMGTKGVETL